jgi:hypothetical protein
VFVEKPGMPRMARIKHALDPNSLLAILAGRRGDTNLPMQERWVDARCIEELQ